MTELPQEAEVLLEAEPLPPEQAARVLAQTLYKAGLSPEVKGERTKMKKIRFGTVLLIGAMLAGSMAVCAAAYFRMDDRLAEELGVGPAQTQEVSDGAGNDAPAGGSQPLTVDAFAQSGNDIQSSAVSEGWTLTVQQAVGDRNCAYLLLDLTAPVGTVLDADNYWLFCSPMFEDASSGGLGVNLLDDEDPSDNHLSFIVDMSFNMDMRSAAGTLYASGLTAIHWSEDHQNDQTEPVTDASWEVPFWLDYQDEVVTLQLDQTVQSSLGEIRVGTVELSPLSVSLELSGPGAQYNRLDTVVDGVISLPGYVQLELLNTRGERIRLGSLDATKKKDGVSCVLILAPVVDPAEIATLVIDGVPIPLK